MTNNAPPRLPKDPGQKKLYVAAGSALAVLIVAALGVIFVLPAGFQPNNSPVTANNPAATETAGAKHTATAGPDQSARGEQTDAEAKVEQHRITAEMLLSDVLRKQTALESDGIKIWGAEQLTTSYSEALDILATANTSFDEGRYTEAAAEFRKVLTILDTLDASKDERYGRAMADGNGALAIDNAESAVSAFTIALALRPKDPSAAAGQARAQSLPDVLRSMEQGRRLEISGDLDGAYQAFKSAVDLDPIYRPAQEEARRTGQLVADRDYMKFISEAIQAIDGRKFSSAAKALSAAQKIRPETHELAELSERLRDERQAAQIGGLSLSARQSAVEENWEKAAAHYKRILSMEPTVAVALNGLRRAERMIRLHRQIAVYLDDPDRLSSDGPLEHARQVLRAATASENKGPRLARESARLGDLVAAASRPRTVILKSDGETAVTIYRVSHFGSFTEKRLELRPGKYTAVGSRPGFRDVRVAFRVSGTGEPTTLVVQCTERI